MLAGCAKRRYNDVHVLEDTFICVVRDLTKNNGHFVFGACKPGPRGQQAVGVLTNGLMQVCRRELLQRGGHSGT